MMIYISPYALLDLTLTPHDHKSGWESSRSNFSLTASILLKKQKTNCEVSREIPLCNLLIYTWKLNASGTIKVVPWRMQDCLEMNGFRIASRVIWSHWAWNDLSEVPISGCWSFNPASSADSKQNSMVIKVNKTGSMGLSVAFTF